TGPKSFWRIQSSLPSFMDVGESSSSALTLGPGRPTAETEIVIEIFDSSSIVSPCGFDRGGPIPMIDGAPGGI
ncbi:MAG TPA: hypothetical protein VLR50_10950, partial [Desulfobacterales bacterium]|nr:hypothetical protein [Desulfobacterales bacterium]